MSAYRAPAPPAGQAFPKLRRFRPTRTLPALQGTLLALNAWFVVAMLLAFTLVIALQLNFRMPTGEIGILH